MSLPVGWERKKLSDFILLQRGFDLPNKKRRPGNYKVISAGDVHGWHNEYRVSGPGFTIGRVTNIGRPTWSEEDFWPLNTTLYAKDLFGNDVKFAYYWFLGTDLSGYNSGSVQPTLNRNYIVNVPIDVPPVIEQQAIAATLGALDDKIESNRRTLNILFELTNEIAKKMLSENELKVHELGELVAFNKSSIKTGQFAEIDYIDIKSVGQGNIESMIHYRFADAPSRARRMLHDGDVIYSTVRPERQAFSPIFMPEPNLIVSTGFAVMSPKEKIGTSFLTYIAGSESFAKYLASAASGSAYPAVSVSAMGKYRVSLPANTTILDLYEQMTLPMRRLGAQLLKESQQVESLRDALLPELMSGRICVPEAQEAIAEVIPEEDDEHASKTSRG